MSNHRTHCSHRVQPGDQSQLVLGFSQGLLDQAKLRNVDHCTYRADCFAIFIVHDICAIIDIDKVTVGLAKSIFYRETLFAAANGQGNGRDRCVKVVRVDMALPPFDGGIRFPIVVAKFGDLRTELQMICFQIPVPNRVFGRHRDQQCALIGPRQTDLHGVGIANTARGLFIR